MANPNINRRTFREIGMITLGVSIGALGLYHIGLSCTVNEFLGWLASFNQQRASCLQNATKDHPEDELNLLQAVSPLSRKHGIALANKIGRMQIRREDNGKLHRRLLDETGRIANEMNE